MRRAALAAFFSQRLSVGQCLRHCCAPFKAQMSMPCIDVSKYRSIFGIASNACGYPHAPFHENFILKFSLILLVGAYPQTPYFLSFHTVMTNSFFCNSFLLCISEILQKNKKAVSCFLDFFKSRKIADCISL